ncbi:MAG: cation-transporting P-type ATPase [Deltaproteobacteria bacterium]
MDIKAPYSIEPDELLGLLDVSAETGLNSAGASERLRKYGKNRLAAATRLSAWTILIRQLKSLIVALLTVAAIISILFGDWPEGIAIIAVILINTAIGFFTEIRAVRSMEALYKLVRIDAKIRREGNVKVLPSEQIVPGDIVILEAGDIVPADLRIIKASNIESSESSLTGESVPVGKNTEAVSEDTPIADRTNMLFMSTPITKGRGEGVVTATGLNTEIGRISALVQEAEEEKTPLEKSLDRLGNKLIWVTILLAVLVIITGILRGRDILLMVETGIALAVAAIPEGLPVVATIALARGMLRMAERNALVNRLSAVETLGSTNVICTDKTGTLTENKMSVELIATDSGAVRIVEGGKEGEAAFLVDGVKENPREDDILMKVLETGVLCNTASLNGSSEKNADAIGDPLEIALLIAGLDAGIDRNELLSRYPETGVEPFDRSVNMMATFHKSDGVYRVAVKGAPDSVLESSTSILTEKGEMELTKETKEEWSEKNEELAGRGYRIIAHAEKTAGSPDEEPYANLTFLGLVCLLDPPRSDIRESIERCLEAGIKVVMVTGDQPSTARNIAHAVGLVENEEAKAIHGKDLRNIEGLSERDKEDISGSLILARVSPEQKLDVISLYQERGNVVAMTGDGVNDAPALKQADIGIAMGLRGTQVAREAADIVLKDDSFSTIVHAIEQGRTIFGNIRKFIFYLISCNVSEIMVVTIASFASIPLPILPLQILFLNLVTDVFPALALGMGEGNENIMKMPPREPGEPIITRRSWLGIAGYGLLITAAVLGALLISIKELGFDDQRAVSVSFLTLAFVQLFHVFNMREARSGLVKNEVTRNKYVWGAIMLCAVIILTAVYFTPAAQVLSVANPGADGWTLVIAISLIPLVIGQALKYVLRP